MNRRDRSAIDFSSFIRERTEFFTGRRWVFEAIHQWFLQTAGPRFYLLTGKPGSGKTAIAARLCQFSGGEADSFKDLPAFQTKGFLNAYHFCSARDSNWIDPRSFVRSLALQLAAYYPEFADALLSTGDQTINVRGEATAGTAEENAVVAGVVIENLSLSGTSSQETFNRIIADPLRHIYQSGFNQPITILVDSLDESLDHKGDINIAGLLSRVKHLPPEVRFILTSRDDDRLSIEFLEEAEVLTLSENHDEDNQEDIREYVRWRLDHDAALSAKAKLGSPKEVDQLVETVTVKAEGNFLYVTFLLNILATPQRSLTDLDGLPTGLEGLYYDSMKRVISQGSRDWTTSYSPSMGVLSVAQAPVTFDQIQQFTAQPTNEVWAALTDLQQFIKEDQIVSESSHSETVYRLYHQSVIDFLRRRQMTMKDQQVNNRYYLEPGEWHLRIAGRYLDGQPDWTQWDDYGVRYLATHLAEAAQVSTGSQQHKQVERLVDLVTDRSFQQIHKQRINDLPLLQRDLDRALKAAAADQDVKALPLLVKIAMAITAFRRQELRPNPLFELARQGEVEDAKRRLELFEIDADWKQVALLTIAWLAAETEAVSARTLRNQVNDALSPSEPLQLLLSHVNAYLDGTPLPPSHLPPAPPEEVVRELVANLGGKESNTELIDAYSHELMNEGLFDGAPGGTPGYFAERDAPLLVAYADTDRSSGDQYFRQYISIHTGYNYVHYRNRSLLYLLNAVLQSHDQQWVKETVTALTIAALAGNTVEFQEGLPLTVRGLRAMSGAMNDVEAQLTKTLFEVSQLRNERNEGDSWGHFRRRFASLAQVYSVLLKRQTEAAGLLETALKLPYGFAGFNAPASLFVAEAIHVCKPGDFASINRALDAALSSAHNIQDAIFCARSTARVNAMRERWWGPSALDVKQVIPRFCQDRTKLEFAALHRIGEQYEFRHHRSAALPDWLRNADRLSALARVYQRPLDEFLRLNREQGWTAEQQLETGTEVNVPDPGFASILSPRFAVEALCDTTLSQAQRVKLIQQLVPIAAISPAALDTVLARLLLAARVTDEIDLRMIEQMASESSKEGRSTGPALRPYAQPGIPS